MKSTGKKTEAKGASGGNTKYHLRLFIAGNEPNSTKAKETLQQLCETRLNGNHRLEIIDVIEDFEAALNNNVLVTPTLIVMAPQPPATIIGSLTDVRKVLDALGLSDEESLNS